MKRVLSKLDLTQYSDGWVLMRDGEPNSIFDTEEDARNAFYWSGRGDYEYGLGAHDYEVKRWEGGQLIDASQSVTGSADSSWDKLSPYDQTAVEFAEDLIKQGHTLRGAANEAVERVNGGNAEPEYADEDFYQEEASVSAVLSYLKAVHPELSEPQPRRSDIKSSKDARDSLPIAFVDLVNDVTEEAISEMEFNSLSELIDYVIDEIVFNDIHWSEIPKSVAYWIQEDEIRAGDRIEQQIRKYYTI